VAVALNASVVGEFSQPLDPFTVTASTAYLSFYQWPFGYQSVPGTLSVTGGPNGPNTIVTFTPASPLAPNTYHTVTVTQGITSATGIPLRVYGSSGFTTGVEVDTDAPAILAVNPTEGSTAVPLNAAVGVEFDEPMRAITLNSATFTVQAAGVPVAGRVVVSDGARGPQTVATFLPDAPLAANSTFAVGLTTDVTDAAGNPLAGPFVATFSTGTSSDTALPTVISVTPSNGASGISPLATVSLQLNEPIDALSANTSTFRLWRDYY
jgi:hypothetical protein